MKNILIKLKNDPQNYDLNLELGLVYLKNANYKEAVIIFKKIIKLNNMRYEGFLNLSIIFTKLKNFEQAEQTLKNFINKNGYNKKIISTLATFYFNNKNFIELKKLLNHYLNEEENYLLYYFKSVIYERKDNISKQKKYLIKSINSEKNFWEAYEKLFNLYEKTNKIDKFEKLIKKTYKIFHNNIKIYYYSALCLYRKDEIKLSLEQIQLNNIEKKFTELGNNNYLISLYDLLSKIYLKDKKYKLALEFAIKRNTFSLKSNKNKKFDRQIILDTIDKYKSFYQSAHISINNEKNGLYHENLVFLVGFPRSGTTLLDSILRSHSKTLVLEEKPYLLDIRHNFFKKNKLENIMKISENEIIQLQKKYFSNFSYSDKKIIIDKFPLNIIEIGFIKRIFPKSRIIVSLRHPLDSILSCVLTSFKINEAMANYQNLETSAFFYNKVFELFYIYNKKFNFPYHKIKYENIVNNFDNEIKNLLMYLNLNFEDSLTNFYITAQKRDKINTPSYNQVIKPIYSDSLYRFKKFPDIEKVISIVEKWIIKFNYN